MAKKQTTKTRRPRPKLDGDVYAAVMHAVFDSHTTDEPLDYDGFVNAILREALGLDEVEEAPAEQQEEPQGYDEQEEQQEEEEEEEPEPTPPKRRRRRKKS